MIEGLNYYTLERLYIADGKRSRCRVAKNASGKRNETNIFCPEMTSRSKPWGIIAVVL